MAPSPLVSPRSSPSWLQVSSGRPREASLSATAAALVGNLPSLGFANSTARKQRLIIMISPNGTIPNEFWPDQTGKDFELKEILQPLAKFQDRMLITKGISNRVRGDGDSHMRGMSCLLTGIELYPGNIQGGSHTPAGWASGPSIDQVIANYLQTKAETKTRFGGAILVDCHSMPSIGGTSGPEPVATTKRRASIPNCSRRRLSSIGGQAG